MPTCEPLDSDASLDGDSEPEPDGEPDGTTGQPPRSAGTTPCSGIIGGSAAAASAIPPITAPVMTALTAANFQPDFTSTPWSTDGGPLPAHPQRARP